MGCGILVKKGAGNPDMKCHSIDSGTPKRYHVVCKSKYFALNTLSSRTQPQDFNP